MVRFVVWCDAKFVDVNRHIHDKFALLSQRMIEDNILRLISDHETRMQKPEQKHGDGSL